MRNKGLRKIFNFIVNLKTVREPYNLLFKREITTFITLYQNGFKNSI